MKLSRCELIDLVNERFPYSEQIKNMLPLMEENAIRFSWRGHKLRVSDSGMVEEIKGSCLHSNALALSLSALMELPGLVPHAKPKTVKKWIWVMSDDDGTPLWLSREHCTEYEANEIGRPIQKIELTMIEVEI